MQLWPVVLWLKVVCLIMSPEILVLDGRISRVWITWRIRIA